VYNSWSGLNPTERYFTLLETWLLRGYPEIAGEQGIRFHSIGRYHQDCAALIYSAQGDGLPVADNDRVGWYFRYSPGLYGVALLEMFGFLSVAHGRTQEGEGWQIDHVTSTPLGMAVFALLGKGVFSDFDKILELEESPSEAFGALRPVFQPYVPAWRSNLSLPAWAFREGVHVFKVSLWSGLWRRIAIPGALPLEELAETIIGAFGFTYDHLYQFSYRNRFGVETHINHPYMDDGPWASEVRVGDVALQEGQSMTYLYDFSGDRWEFEVTLERVDLPDREMKEPAILDARGARSRAVPELGRVTIAPTT